MQEFLGMSSFLCQQTLRTKTWKKRLVINYKALNEALVPVKYPLPNKEILLSKIVKANVFSKFDLKVGFGKLALILRIGIKRHSWYLEDSFNGQLFHLV